MARYAREHGPVTVVQSLSSDRMPQRSDEWGSACALKLLYFPATHPAPGENRRVSASLTRQPRHSRVASFLPAPSASFAFSLTAQVSPSRSLLGYIADIVGRIPLETRVWSFGEAQEVLASPALRLRADVQ